VQACFLTRMQPLTTKKKGWIEALDNARAYGKLDFHGKRQSTGSAHGI